MKLLILLLSIHIITSDQVVPSRSECPTYKDRCRYQSDIRCYPNQKPCSNCWLKPRSKHNRREYWRCVRPDEDGSCPYYPDLVDVVKDCKHINYNHYDQNNNIINGINNENLGDPTNKLKSNWL